MQEVREKIRMAVTKGIALSLERHLSNHGITQCTIRMDIDMTMRAIDQALGVKDATKSN